MVEETQFLDPRGECVMEDPLEEVTSGPSLEKQAVIDQKQIQKLEIPPG